MKKIIVILLAFLLVVGLVGCMKNNNVDTLYKEVDSIRADITQLEKDNEKLEQDNIHLEKQLKELANMDLSKQEKELQKDYVVAKREVKKMEIQGMGITPDEINHYIFNLTIMEEDFIDLDIDLQEYIYESDGYTVYQYNYTKNKNNNPVIFMECLLDNDCKHIEYMRVCYDKDMGDMNQYQLFDEYIDLFVTAFVMLIEDANVLTSEVKDIVKSILDGEEYEGYDCAIKHMGGFKTFKISRRWVGGFK